MSITGNDIMQRLMMGNLVTNQLYGSSPLFYFRFYYNILNHLTAGRAKIKEKGGPEPETQSIIL